MAKKLTYKKGSKIDYTSTANKPATKTTTQMPQYTPQYSIGEQWAMEHPQQYIGPAQDYNTLQQQRDHEYLRNRMYQQEQEERANREFAQKLKPGSELVDKMLTADMMLSGAGMVNKGLRGVSKKIAKKLADDVFPHSGNFPVQTIKNTPGNTPMPTITEVPELTKEQQILQSFGVNPYHQRQRHNPKIDQWIREDASDMSEYALDEPMEGKVKDNMRTTLRMLQSAQERQKRYGISTPLDKQLLKDFDTKEPTNYLIQTYSQNKYGGQTNNNDMKRNNIQGYSQYLLHRPLYNGGQPIMQTGGGYDPFLIRQPLYNGGQPIVQNGGMIYDTDDPTPEYGKGGHWIQKAVNPAHKGYCTPMTKSTCTPRRKAFAMTMKKHHGFHKNREFGGPDDPNVTETGETPGTDISQGFVPQTQRNRNVLNLGQMNQLSSYGTQLLGAGLGLGSYINSMNNARDVHKFGQQMGQTQYMQHMNQPGVKGDYSPNTGYFRPQEMTSANTGYFAPAYGKYGGQMKYQNGGTYDIDDVELNRLKKLGYKFEMI